ncbi:hypothetical protein NDA11_006306 [Ustilago hordei]|uniref:ER membrane protein complex subunit 10 n=1 Tax=Ustilago hordei TaxID=120017 RepID=I2G2T1_USTHO|nr:uncharacterized protein UHO2_02892 [Ustilago hordei]KAJ1038275.1 hypothetical protein NDA10_008002 [Ustilago hordei]KAJ1585414.1 hypothetical protein NDA15_006009 [Ustilago hordei]KAJ1588226.1 hypothetical protein NDA12_005189 [Ustilago hordei]KAJ1593237.1 hypothetical protein NDA11_006306 [Ustilago hordei]UTT94295.1 hypothetical protein NDA17_004514 [Ustilago hordei]
MRVTISSLLLLFTTTLTLASVADAASYNLLHRINPSSEWSLRATIELDPISLGTNSSLALSNKLSSRQVEGLKEEAYKEDAGQRFYQVALTEARGKLADGAEGEEVSLMTSIRLCHLRQSHPDLPTLDDELVLTLRPAYSPSPSDTWRLTVTGLSYRVLDISLSPQSCPLGNPTKLNTMLSNARKVRARRRNPSSIATERQQGFNLNTKLITKHTQRVKDVTLKQAMPTNQDGTVKPVEKEKSFLQKYWFYLIPVAILLVMPPGEEEPKQSGARGARGKKKSI